LPAYRTVWSLRELTAIYPETPIVRFRGWVNEGTLPTTNVAVGHLERHVDRRGLLQAHLLVALFGKVDPSISRQVINALPEDLVQAFERLPLEDAEVPDVALIVAAGGVTVFIPAPLRTLVERIQRARLVV
jgi:hypothetical protein